MDFQGSHKFAAAPQQVWTAMMNPAVLQACIPGVDEVTMSGNTINMRINVNTPFLKGEFAIPAEIVSQTPPSNAVLHIDRTGSYGTIKGQATINLAPDGAGTNLTYTVHADLSGKAGMANNMIGEQAAKAALGQFFKNLDSKV